ncbi:uncharacterized protein LOC131249619 [Magnolia sinica]|uniref:uncharacterized protein LOC131249619 n=1 Tax=Magnolia sinica TaxID=86752 RepID=UPI002659DF86|nr:uncharacterized protein LOC131249619 [Magnolia sinica]
MVEFVRDFKLKLTEEPYETVAHFRIQLLIDNWIIEAQGEDELLMGMKKRADGSEESEWRVGSDGGLRYHGRLCIPNLHELRKEVLDAAQNSKLAMHPGSTKMYRDLKQAYWWNNMKNQIVDYVSRCLTYQEVKAEYHRPSSLLQPMSLAECK